MKPSAGEVRKEEATLPDSDYYTYADAYSWEHFLDSRPDSGWGAAVIKFQKFDDGWRIVDSTGQSEKEFAAGK